MLQALLSSFTALLQLSGALDDLCAQEEAVEDRGRLLQRHAAGQHLGAGEAAGRWSRMGITRVLRGAAMTQVQTCELSVL